MFKLFVSLIFLLSTSLFAKNITIAVAANVSYAIDELKKEFNKEYPDINVRVILGGSGKLTAQIRNGAPFELFMSANMIYPQALYNEKLALFEPHIYAQGALAYFSVKKRDFSDVKSILEANSISKIAIANPKTAPYGKAAFEALTNAHILEKIRKKFIYAESISQTVSYSVSAADIGIIAKSALYSKQMRKYKENHNWREVESSLYRPIDQGIVILTRGQSSKSVRAFYDFMLSEKAKKIFQRYGYSTL